MPAARKPKAEKAPLKLRDRPAQARDRAKGEPDDDDGTVYEAYLVTGSQPVFGVAVGGVVELNPHLAQTRRLLDRGAIAPDVVTPAEPENQ